MKQKHYSGLFALTTAIACGIFTYCIGNSECYICKLLACLDLWLLNCIILLKYEQNKSKLFLTTVLGKLYTPEL